MACGQPSTRQADWSSRRPCVTASACSRGRSMSGPTARDCAWSRCPASRWTSATGGCVIPRVRAVDRRRRRAGAARCRPPLTSWSTRASPSRWRSPTTPTTPPPPVPSAAAAWGSPGTPRTRRTSVLTRLPAPARRTPATVARLLAASFPATRHLSATDAGRLIASLAGARHRGRLGTYDALVGATAAEHALPLATRDRRALDTYRALGVRVGASSADGPAAPSIRSPKPAAMGPSAGATSRPARWPRSPRSCAPSRSCSRA